jgi:glycyl-tRNA synthetase
MSIALYNTGGLRFWNEREILMRDQCVARITNALKTSLRGLNKAWAFQQLDAPILTPRDMVSATYDERDIWFQQHRIGDREMVLRPETTASSYLYADHIIINGLERLPLCVWQVGKSCRIEYNDGATAAKLRFNEFYQLEYQCIFSAGSNPRHYHSVIVSTIHKEIADILAAYTNDQHRVVSSDRLPTYSEITEDVEVTHNGQWREMCSISTRTDCPLGSVVEVAIGVDRLVSVMEIS